MSLFGLYGARERFREPLARLLLPAVFVELLVLSSVYFLAFGQPYAFPRSVLVLYIVLDVAAARDLAIASRPTDPAAAPPGGHRRRGPRRPAHRRRDPEAPVDRCRGRRRDRRGRRRGRPPSARARRGIAALAESERIDDLILTPEGPTWRDRLAHDLPAGISHGAARLAVAVRDDDRAAAIPHRRGSAAARSEDGPARGPRGGRQARLRRAASAELLLIALGPILALAALFVARHLPRRRLLQAEARRQERRASSRSGSSARCGPGAEIETGAVLATPDDPRVTARRPSPARGARGRDPAALERAARRHEPRRPASRAAGVHRRGSPRPSRGTSLRHAVRPGVTGLAQISGDYSSEPEIKLRYDLAYLNNWSLGLDLAILLRTLPVILTRRGI